MKNLIAIAAGAIMLIAGSASAATISNPVFSNGDITIDAQGNSTVSGTFTLQVGQNEVCEVLRTQADPSQPFTDAQVGGPLGYQWGTHTNVPFSVKVPPNTATYYPTTQCAGIWGGNHSVDGADNVVANANLGTLRVTATGSSSVGSSSLLDQLTQQVADLMTMFACMQTGGTYANKVCTPKPTEPAKPAFCAQLAAAAGNTFALQSTLVSAGFMTQGEMNTGPGIYGPKTTKYHAMAMLACK